FSPDYFGRLELMVCLDDEVEVAVQATRYHGQYYRDTAMAVPIASPADFKPVLVGPRVGSTIAYDARPHPLLYAAEYSDRIIRYDRRTGEVNDRIGEPFVRRWKHPVSSAPETGSLIIHNRGVQPNRDRVYLAEWMQGRYAYAIDLSTLQPVARYDVEN